MNPPAPDRPGPSSGPTSDPSSGPSAASSPAAPADVQLTVLPLGTAIPLRPGQSLLQAALAARLRLPASCRNGTCRTCVCRLAAGQVRYLIDWPGLLAEEKAEGWILPCVATADQDLVIHVPGAQPLF